MISCYGGASEAVSARIGSAWKKFRELSGVLREVMEIERTGKRKKVRPRKSWEECVKMDLE